MQGKLNKNLQKGFTLIELLTVITTLGVLASLGIATFSTMRRSAAHGAALQALMNARTAIDAALINPDVLVPFVEYSQTTPGSIMDMNAGRLLVGFQNSSQMAVNVYHDPDCLDETCQADYVEIFHCKSQDYPSYTRYGDGVQVILEHLPGTIPCA